MRRALQIAGLIALAGCRQVFGISEPDPVADAPRVFDARPDGPSAFIDGSMFASGLAMHVLPGMALWSSDQSPDAAWSKTSVPAAAGVWNGTGPSEFELALDGVDTGKPFSVWMEGQAYAAGGSETLELTANDYAFFDAESLPNTGVYMHVATSSHGTGTPASGNVPAGWYRVRIGWSSSNSMASLQVLHGTSQDPNVVPYSSTNLRH
jgi:hypothetical protein